MIRLIEKIEYATRPLIEDILGESSSAGETPAVFGQAAGNDSRSEMQRRRAVDGFLPYQLFGAVFVCQLIQRSAK